MKNLQNLRIPDDGYNGGQDQKDNSVIKSDCKIEVIFRNQKERLLELISNYSCVVGCVAWLTDFDILSAMAKMDSVSIIVQKEDFLRPDLNAGNGFSKKLRYAYEELPCTERFFVEGLVSELSWTGDTTLDSIRCMGNHNSNKSPSFPRMHNKFLVFTDRLFNHQTEFLELTISHTACVWTGSYNISQTATKSLENAIIIHDNTVAQAYFNEWSQITALSEPLNWESEWCSPEWRIGT